ncbi:hypothetical protein HK100_010486, partial [Physocladia obscura]
TLKRTDYDEDGSEYIDFFQIHSDSSSMCLYDLESLKPPVVDLGLGGTKLHAGKILMLFSIKHKYGISRFARLQSYQVAPEHDQNETGCYILSPDLRLNSSVAVVPIHAIEARAHLISYFQDGQNGKFGKVYLNTFVD